MNAPNPEDAPATARRTARGSEFRLRIPRDRQQTLKTGAEVKCSGGSPEELVACLWDFMLHVEVGSLLVWDDLSPETSPRNQPGPEKSMANYLAQKTELTLEEFARAVERSKVLVTALLLAVSGRSCAGFRGGIHKYASDLESKFKPDRIRTDAEMEKKWYESIGRACWGRYERLAEEEDMTAEKIAYRLKQALAEEAQEWLAASSPGRAANPGTGSD